MDQENNSNIKINSEIEDRCFGCILGSFIGDACGSYNEFNKQIVDESKMKECMNMPGGGPFKLIAPGQITDDSELALCLMQGINQGIILNQQICLDTDQIAHFYGEWMNSPPFDIGITIKGAFQVLLDNKTRLAQNAKKMAKQYNQKSQSNGALMRCSPMAVWTSNLQSDIEIKQAVAEDVELSHSNIIVLNSVFLYTKAIHYLINNPQEIDRNKKAFELVFILSQQDIANQTDNNISCFQMLQEAQKLANQADLNGDDKNFLLDKYNTRVREGHVYHAMVLCFYFLLIYKQEKENSQLEFYFKALKETIQLGGDTDTNACIVGGMIGCLVGLAKIPNQMIESIIRFDCTKQGIKRPQFLSVNNKAQENIQQIIINRPEKLFIINHNIIQQNKQVNKMQQVVQKFKSLLYKKR